MIKSNFLTFTLFLFVFAMSNTVQAEMTEDCIDEKPAVAELVRMCNFSTESATAFAPGGGTSSCDASNALVLNSGENCQSEIILTVYATNLHLEGGVPTEPTIGMTYYLPLGMPGIKVEYDSDFDGFYDQISTPIYYFTYNGLQITTQNGQHAFIFEREMALLYVEPDLCDDGQGGYITTNTANTSMPCRLISAPATIYPINDYAGPNDVFSCNVFLETCGSCTTTPPLGCTPSDPVYDPAICFDCIPCKAPAIKREDKGNDIEEGSAQILDNPTLLHKVQPNPFNTHLDVTFELAKEEEIQLVITDLQGKQVRRHTAIYSTGVQTESLNLSNLPLGIYFCTLQTSHGLETIKVVKGQ